MKKLTIILLLASMSVTHGADLDSLREAYETEVQKIRDGHENALSRLLDSYGASVDKAIEILRRQGDPDSVLVASEEQTRFGRERTVPNPSSDKLPRMLRDVQANYHEAVKSAEVEKGRRFVELTKRYLTAIDRLMRQHTNDNELDLALNTKQERERVAFVLADVESKLKAIEEREKAEAAKAAIEARRAKLPPEARDAHYWGGSFYKFFEAKSLRWDDCQARCRSMGGRLVLLETEARANFVTSIIRGRYIYVGGYYDRRNRGWYWAKDKRISFFRWASGQPNQLDESPRLAISPSNRWYDMPKRGDSRTSGFVCEWK